MYRAIGLPLLLSVYAFFAVIVALGKLTFWPGATPLDYWTATSAGLAFSSALFGFVGGLPQVFDFLCRHTWLGRRCPPIAGTWDVTLTSNWPTVAKAHKVPGPHEAEIKGEARIVATLFKVTIKYESLSEYSDSETISVSVDRCSDTGDVRIYDIYRNTTRKPKAGDEQLHYGAAYMDVKRPGGEVRISGVYWTNRNWTQAKSTAGLIFLTRKAV